MKKDQGIYRNAFLRLDSSAIQPYNFADKLLLQEREDSRLKIALQVSELELQNAEGFSPIHLLALQFSLCSETLARMVLRPHLSNKNVS